MEFQLLETLPVVLVLESTDSSDNLFLDVLQCLNVSNERKVSEENLCVEAVVNNDKLVLLFATDHCIQVISFSSNILQRYLLIAFIKFESSGNIKCYLITSLGTPCVLRYVTYILLGATVGRPLEEPNRVFSSDRISKFRLRLG